MKNAITSDSYKRASHLFFLAEIAKREGLTTLSKMLMAEHNLMLARLNAR